METDEVIDGGISAENDTNNNINEYYRNPVKKVTPGLDNNSTI